MPFSRRENVRHATLLFRAEGINVQTTGAGEKEGKMGQIVALWIKCLLMVSGVAFLVEWYQVNLKWALIGLGIGGAVVLGKVLMPTSIELGSSVKKFNLQLTYLLSALGIAGICWAFGLVYIPLTIVVGALFPKNSDHMPWEQC
jgi:hypothetical protein